MTANNQTQKLLPTGRENTGLTIYENSQRIIQEQIQWRIGEIVKLWDAGLISTEQLQKQIENIMQEVSSKVDFLLLPKDQRDTYKLAVNMFHKNPKAVLEMLKTERQEERWNSWEEANIIQFSTEWDWERIESKAA